MNRVAACFELASEAASILRAMRSQIQVDLKGFADPVTQADRAAESFLMREILQRFPGDGFLGEEGAEENSRNGWLWIADPIDGTVNYVHGLPHFSVSLGLLKDGEPIAGAVVQAATKEHFQAERGGGSYRDSKRLSVSSTSKLQDALAATDFPYDHQARVTSGVKRFATLINACQGVRVLGSCALELCRVAAGELDLYCVEGTKAWDVAAGALILQEAGGVITDWDGAKLDVLNPRRPFASNRALNQEALALAVNFS
jgi:myo-inositol-1(or 4)-monophosphatase